MDKYAGLVILQLLAKGLDSQDVRDTCVKVLREELSPNAILERPDPRVRELEGLVAPATSPLYLKKASAKSSTQFHLNGLVFQYDADAGQKTGAFLDQRSNYAAARDWAQKLATGNPTGAAAHSMSVATRVDSRCTWRRSAAALRESMLRTFLLKLRKRISQPIART